MPLIELPNGKFANVDDATSPETIAQLRRDNTPKAGSPPTRVQARASGIPRSTRADRNDDEYNKRVAVGRKIGANNPVGRGILANFDDEISGGISAATRGVYRAVTKGDVGEIGKEYRLARDVERNVNEDFDERHPILSTGGQIIGATMAPAGLAKGGVAAAGNVASRVGLKAAGRTVGRVAARMGRAGPVAAAAMEGAAQGALNGAGASKEDTLGSAVEGAATGGIMGGAVGAALKVGSGVANVLKDRRPDRATDVAYEKIEAMLDKGQMTPEQAADELRQMQSTGADVRTMDLTPNTRAETAALARRPELAGSNALIDGGEQRIGSRPERFSERVDDLTGSTQDALSRGDDIAAARSKAGNEDYPAVLDKNFVWNDELEDFANGPKTPKMTREALNGAADLIRAERKDPTALGINFDADGNVVFDKVPSMRAFDYVKRSFDDKIGTALRAGDKNGARIMSGELNMLKDGIAKSNPEYAGVLKTQRDMFQQSEALEQGTDVLRRLPKEARQVSRDYEKLTPEQKIEWRTGTIDALQQLDTKADPVAAWRSLNRSPAQRRVWEKVFGDNLDEFDRFITAETKATRTDNVTAPGRQSITAGVQNTQNQQLGDDLAEVGKRTVQGGAFGGVVGAVSNAIRGLGNLASRPSLASQEEIIRILRGKGSDLRAGTRQARRYRAEQQSRRMRRSISAAKGAQQIVTSNPSE